MAVRFLIAWLLFATATFTSASAEENGETTLGIYRGSSAGGYSDGFEQVQVALTSSLRRQWGSQSTLLIRPRIEATVAALSRQDETSLLAWIGPALSAAAVDGRLRFDAAISPALLSEPRFGDRDLGGRLQFITYFGISAALADNFYLGYRLQHMSNGGLYDSNPGINLHVIGLTYRVPSD